MMSIDCGKIMTIIVTVEGRRSLKIIIIITIIILLLLFSFQPYFNCQKMINFNLLYKKKGFPILNSPFRPHRNISSSSLPFPRSITTTNHRTQTTNRNRNLQLTSHQISSLLISPQYCFIPRVQQCSVCLCPPAELRVGGLAEISPFSGLSAFLFGLHRAHGAAVAIQNTPIRCLWWPGVQPCRRLVLCVGTLWFLSFS